MFDFLLFIKLHVILVVSVMLLTNATPGWQLSLPFFLLFFFYARQYICS